MWRGVTRIDSGPDRAHGERDRNASSKRPGLQSNLSAGTHTGVRNHRSGTHRTKGCPMEMPAILKGESLTRLLQGAAAGAVLTMVIGFNWGGWKLGSTAEDMATRRVGIALVEVYAPVCVERFQQQANL